jgi:hypothetical protein
MAPFVAAIGGDGTEEVFPGPEGDSIGGEGWLGAPLRIFIPPCKFILFKLLANPVAIHGCWEGTCGIPDPIDESGGTPDSCPSCPDVPVGPFPVAGAVPRIRAASPKAAAAALKKLSDGLGMGRPVLVDGRVVSVSSVLVAEKDILALLALDAAIFPEGTAFNGPEPECFPPAAAAYLYRSNIRLFRCGKFMHGCKSRVVSNCLRSSSRIVKF